MDIKVVISLFLAFWIITGIIYFAIKFKILKKRKKLKLTEDTVIIYSNKLEEPPI